MDEKEHDEIVLQWGALAAEVQKAALRNAKRHFTGTGIGEMAYLSVLVAAVFMTAERLREGTDSDPTLENFDRILTMLDQPYRAAAVQ